MPRYFIEFEDGERSLRDGSPDLTDLEQARNEAVAVLAEAAHDILPKVDHRSMVSVVKDEAGRTIFRAALVFDAEWLR